MVGDRIFRVIKDQRNTVYAGKKNVDYQKQ